MLTTAPGAAGAHAGQHGLGDGDGAEDVGGEQLGDGVLLALLHRGAVAVAGVVDQHVDPAEALLGGADGGGHLTGVGDVEGERERRLGEGVGEVGDAPASRAVTTTWSPCSSTARAPGRGRGRSSSR